MKVIYQGYNCGKEYTQKYNEFDLLSSVFINNIIKTGEGNKTLTIGKLQLNKKKNILHFNPKKIVTIAHYKNRISTTNVKEPIELKEKDALELFCNKGYVGTVIVESL